MSERGMRLRLGLFTLLAAGTLAGLIVLFAGAPRLFRQRVAYQVVFPDAPGLTPGTPVRRSGVRIGEVAGLELVPETGLVRVTLSLDPRFPPRSLEDITVTRGLITNDTSVDFIPRESGKRDLGDPVSPGADLVGIPPPSTRAILAQAQEVLPSAQASLDQIRRSVERFERAAPRLEEALANIRDAAGTIGEFVPELRRTNDEIRALAAGVRTLGPDVRKTNDQLQVLLTNASRVAEEVDVLIRTNEPAVRSAIQGVAKAVDAANELIGPANRESVNRTIRNASAASERLEPALRGVEDSLKRLGTTTDELAIEVKKLLERATRSFDNVQTRFEAFVERFRPILGRVERVAANVETASEQIARGSEDVRAVIREFARADGTVQKLLTDGTLYARVSDLFLAFSKLAPKVERILIDTGTFADKIARHPESIGVGGVVRPSSGLKDPPSAPVRPGVIPAWP